MNLYTVKYTFNAEEGGELSVSKGDVVRVSGSGEVSKDGWTLVETISAPFVKGYVPSNYIKKSDPPVSTTSSASNISQRFDFSSPRNQNKSTTSSPRLQTKQSSPTRASKNGPIRRLSDPRLAQHLLESLEVGSDADQSEYSEPLASSPMPPPPSSNSVSKSTYNSNKDSISLKPQLHRNSSGDDNRTDFAHLFEQLDTWYNDLLIEREQQYSRLENSTSQLIAHVSSSKERNKNLTRQIANLNAKIEEQRKLLKTRIDDDSRVLHERFNTLYS